MNTNDYAFIKKNISYRQYQNFKGVRSHQRIPVNKIMGFFKFDTVKWNNIRCFIKGRMSSGYAIEKYIRSQD
ncbi:MAG: hypothetical protein LBT10_00775 [Methanobrevibacter sp.]|nr:hypothetical protein [Methanobrevibacter sp.]